MRINTSSPPGRFTDDNNNKESNLEFVSTFQRFCCTSVILPTTISPTSPLYLLFRGLTEVKLLTCSRTPATDDFKNPSSS